MALHKNTGNAFAEYLFQHGYPKESVAFEWGDKDHTADIAVLDLDTNMPISIYEIKVKKDIQLFRSAVTSLKFFAGKLRYPITYGVLFAKEEYPYFEYIEATQYVFGIKHIPDNFDLLLSSNNDEPVAYKGRVQSVKSSVVKESQEKKEAFGNILKVISWGVVPLITIGLIILDASNIYPFNAERLIIYGICIVALFMPFVREVKFGDYTLSLRDQNKKESKEESKDVC